MTLPVDLLVIRHGQSEANLRQQDPRGQTPNADCDNRTLLTPRGVEQAKTAGDWLRRNGLTGADCYYTSPYMRARQTAALLGPEEAWIVDERWRERNAGATSPDLTRPLPHKWQWKPADGESLSTDVRQRFESILATLQCEAPDKRVIAVTHGKFMTVVRFVLEQMTIQEWLEKDQHELIDNCQILYYSRRSPKTSAVASDICWMRSVCPWDSSRSWHHGQWLALGPHTLGASPPQRGLDIIRSWPGSPLKSISRAGEAMASAPQRLQESIPLRSVGCEERSA